MTEMRPFTTTLVVALAVAWLLSGTRFLDAAFEMVDLGRFDDIVLSGIVILEQGKANLELPDVFSAMRAGLHDVLGLN